MPLFDSVEFDVATQAMSQDIRDALNEAWEVVDSTLPDSREKSLVKTNMQVAGFWANNCLAVNEIP